MKFHHRQRDINASKEHKLPRHAKMVCLPMPRRAHMCASIARPRMRSSLPHCDCRTSLARSDSDLLIEPSHVAGGGVGGDSGWQRRGHQRVQQPMAIQWPARQPLPFIIISTSGKKLHGYTNLHIRVHLPVLFVFACNTTVARPGAERSGQPLRIGP